MGSTVASRILLVEDERDLAQPVLRNLEEDGFQVGYAPDGASARREFENHWDLVILDLMLPDIPGESLLVYLRQRVDYPNVLVLTAKSSLAEKITLFQIGCDDYLTKPFMYDELLVRIQALLRRPPRANAEDCRYQDLELDFAEMRLKAGNVSVVLTPKEAAICRLLMNQPERVVPRREILHGVWGLKEEPDSNFIGVHVFHLRKKFARLGRDDWFRTVRAAGFVLSNPEAAANET